MGTIEINGQHVNVIAEGIKKFGREWVEIEEYPTIVTHTKRGNHYSDDWVVIKEEGDFVLYMNNGDGYLVLIELEKSHFNPQNGMEVDREGKIFYSSF